MIARYGNYTFPANSTLIATDRQLTVSQDGRPSELTVTWKVSGELFAVGQFACAQAQAAMESACLIPYQDLAFLDDSNNLAMLLPNSSASRGVLITQGPSFQGPKPGFEWVNGRSFTLTATAVYPLFGGAAQQLLSFKESIRRSGGIRRRTLIETINSRPVPVILAQFTSFKATQSGSSQSLLGPPPIMQPIWPSELVGDPEVEETGPDLTNRYFSASWSYQFESVGPLLGSPASGYLLI